MINAIKLVLPETIHRFCLWHISKNAAIQLRGHYGHLAFKSRFNKILCGCVTEAEFNSCWDGLIRDYNLAGDKWLKSLYEIREKWCPVFSLNIFSAKMKASSRSESTNNVFHNMTSKTMSLTEFVLHYETAGKKMCEEELEEDFRCNQGAPAKIVQHSGILRHAASIYTRKIFYLFELEFASTLGVK